MQTSEHRYAHAYCSVCRILLEADTGPGRKAAGIECPRCEGAWPVRSESKAPLKGAVVGDALYPLPDNNRS